MPPSHVHEGLTELFRHRPSLAAELLSTLFKLPVPRWQEVRIESGDLTDLTPTEYRADAVATFTKATRPVLTVVIEVQLRRDPGKRYSWPVYLATIHSRLRCPTVLLVVCPDLATARWAVAPIDLGHPGWVLRPVVLGPDQVPVLTDPDLAVRTPELAVLSALAHGAHPEHEKVFHALLHGLQTVDDPHANLYADIVLRALPEAARHRLEALMSTATHEYQSDFARRYFGQGKAEGKAEGAAEGEAKALLAVLAARGIEISEQTQARISGCTDLDQLDTWVRRAATADSADSADDIIR